MRSHDLVATISRQQRLRNHAGPARNGQMLSGSDYPVRDPRHHIPAVVQLDAQLLECAGTSDSSLGRRLLARVVHIARGPVNIQAVAPDPEEWVGLLVLDGLLVVGLEVGRARASWLVGSEDLIRPWDMPELSLTQDPSWRALADTRVALLDDDFARRAGPIASVTRQLVTRTARTSHWLLAKSLIVSSPVIEERLLLLFALLAERWGKVRMQGVWLSLPLTHDLLARVCGARRPSVTMGLQSLQKQGLVESSRRGCWLLRRHPPSTLTPAWGENGSFQRYASAVGLHRV
jgi:Crp-like helix-turn-helix domain